MPPRKHRARQLSDDSIVTVIERPRSETAATSMVAMSEEQLSSIFASIAKTQAEANRTLIENLRSAQLYTASTPVGSTPCSGAGSADVTAAAPTPHHAHLAGSFAKCTARFSGAGKEDSSEVLEAFLDAVETFKECTNVSDHHALKGLPMLLTGNAALWWQGIKATTATWTDAVAALRGMYGAPRPAYKIFKEIFSSEQLGSDRAEVFITRVRSLISKLPYGLSECVKLDIVYGLLHRRIRKRLPRDSVTTMENLILKARSVEETLAEVGVSESHPNNIVAKKADHPHASLNSNVSPSTTSTACTNKSITTDDDFKSKRNHRYRPRCSYCRLYGHSIEECRKAESKRFNSSTSGKVEVSKSSSSNNNISRDIASPDHTSRIVTNSDAPILRCYGCGQPGVIKSRCTNCKGEVQSATKVEFNTLCSVDSKNAHPMVGISIFGKEGVATLDTGASHSVASPALYKILSLHGVEFIPTKSSINLADGSRREQEVLTTKVNVTIQGRSIPTEFLVLPGYNPKTLLGRDFIIASDIIMDVPSGVWFFSDNVERKFQFRCMYELNEMNDLLHANVNLYSLRSEQRSQVNNFIASTDGPPAELAAHRIKVSDTQEPIACQPYRLPQPEREALQNELHKSLEADIIEKCESPWAANLVLVPKKDEGMRLCIDYRKLNAVTEPFILRTDSSGYALGACLLQGEGTDERPVEYASRLLTATRRFEVKAIDLFGPLPEANPVERKNRDLKPQLAILVRQDHTSWDVHLSAIRFAMNSATTSSTGYSKAFLTFGRELRTPLQEKRRRGRPRKC